MPYFHSDIVNLLFIHIPKTGGTSLEKYFSNKFNIPLNLNSLFGQIDSQNSTVDNLITDISLHHLPYLKIMKFKDFFNINENNLQIITIVRNPYERVISDLFHFKKIHDNTSKEEIYNIITILLKVNVDNHTMPQYLFITDDKKQIIRNIKILKTETLQDDMIKLGYKDFDFKENINPLKVNYYDYLNNDSIKFINEFYDYDFKLFNYEKKEC